MTSQLNAFEDQQEKEVALQPSDVDLEFHRHLADKCAGKDSWKPKLEHAINGPARLNESEFHCYELYRPETTAEDIDAYVGKVRQKELYKTFNSPYCLTISEDKALFELILKGANLPVARTFAIFSEVPRFGFPTELRDEEDVRNFLAKQAFPIFCKPIDGMLGIGAMKIEGFSQNKVSISDKKVEDIHDFYRYISTLSNVGYLFQECIKQAPSVTDLFGPEVCAIRLLVLNHRTPTIESALLRTAGGSAVLDHRWQEGNVLAPVDIASGKILAPLLQGTNEVFIPIRVNPNTGRVVEGATIEHWADACKLVLQAATLLPLARTQSWDVAITNEGPVILEFNWGGSLAMHQLAHKRGMLTPSFKSHLKACEQDPLFVHPIH